MAATGGMLLGRTCAKPQGKNRKSSASRTLGEIRAAVVVRGTGGYSRPQGRKEVVFRMPVPGNTQRCVHRCARRGRRYPLQAPTLAGGNSSNGRDAGLPKTGDRTSWTKEETTLRRAGFLPPFITFCDPLGRHRGAAMAQANKALWSTFPHGFGLHSPRTLLDDSPRGPDWDRGFRFPPHLRFQTTRSETKLAGRKSGLAERLVVPRTALFPALVQDQGPGVRCFPGSSTVVQKAAESGEISGPEITRPLLAEYGSGQTGTSPSITCLGGRPGSALQRPQGRGAVGPAAGGVGLVDSGTSCQAGRNMGGSSKEAAGSHAGGIRPTIIPGRRRCTKGGRRSKHHHRTGILQKAADSGMIPIRPSCAKNSIPPNFINCAGDRRDLLRPFGGARSPATSSRRRRRAAEGPGRRRDRLFDPEGRARNCGLTTIAISRKRRPAKRWPRLGHGLHRLPAEAGSSTAANSNFLFLHANGNLARQKLLESARCSPTGTIFPDEATLAKL